MPKLELKFHSGESSLSVRQFSITEAVSELFAVEVMARSPKADIDLESIVGKSASLRIDLGKKHVKDGVRYWTGLCNHIELIHAEQGRGEQGLSTYSLRIVPDLWLLSQRTNYRIFQHKSIPDIVDDLLEPWKIKPVWKVDRSKYTKFEYKVQYGEADYDFMARLLTEAGIAFTFPDDNDNGSRVTFSDSLNENKPRANKLRYVDQPSQAAESEFITELDLTHEAKSGQVTIRDFDFRNPKFNLSGTAKVDQKPEDNYELYEYRPGGFLRQTEKPSSDTPQADGKGAPRHDPQFGQQLAQQALEAARVDKRTVSFSTNTVDIWPGVVFSIDNHSHPALGSDKKFLVTELTVEGSPTEEWTTAGQAVYADVPFRPPVISKPDASGVQSAIVVGPKGEEIHTDEYGRVRVQFPWDRDGKSDDKSSCWVRVGQGWAGTGFGLINIPRVGQEVLVSFLEGDPEQPIITGRVFNAIQPVPYELPKHKTRSTWRSNSSPGGKGFNEIMFEDLANKELVYLQAQKNLRKLVKNDETITIGRDRKKLVKNDEIEITKKNRTEVTGANRVEITDKNRATVIGGSHSVLVLGEEKQRTEGNQLSYVGKNQDIVVKGNQRAQISGDSHLVVKGDRAEKIHKNQSLTVGKDQHQKVGGKHALEAGKEIHLKAGQSLVVEAALDLTIKGPGGFMRIDPAGVTIKGTLVQLNSGSAQAGKGSDAKPASPDKAKEVKVKAAEKPKPDDISVTGLAQ